MTLKEVPNAFGSSDWDQLDIAMQLHARGGSSPLPAEISERREHDRGPIRCPSFFVELVRVRSCRGSAASSRLNIAPPC
eukprot:3858629-Pyramimonas_sp.AAC.1